MSNKAPTEAEALKAEVEEKSIEFEFAGNNYKIQPGQPSPKALEHIADMVTQDSHIYAILALREILGQAAWDAWCSRHSATEIMSFFDAANGAFAGK